MAMNKKKYMHENEINFPKEGCFIVTPSTWPPRTHYISSFPLHPKRKPPADILWARDERAGVGVGGGERETRHKRLARETFSSHHRTPKLKIARGGC